MSKWRNIFVESLVVLNFWSFRIWAKRVWYRIFQDFNKF